MKKYGFICSEVKNLQKSGCLQKKSYKPVAPLSNITFDMI
jgi:hypothetical protein